MEHLINPRHIQQKEHLGAAFQTAKPFRHISMENFLQPPFLEAIREEFPAPKPEHNVRNLGESFHRYAVRKISELGPAFSQWDQLLQSAEFMDWLSCVTGVPDLIFDPDYHGGGTHNNLHGQDLLVHIDFNLHRLTGYHRRLNLIVYISEEWSPDWGGSLELHKDPWDADNDEYVTLPAFGNSAIIFETNEHSWHGFQEINLPEEKRHLSRKSLAVYYYTKERPPHELAPKHTTVYVPRQLSGAIRPGEVITASEYAELKKNFEKRNELLKGLYTRDTDHIRKYENLKKMLQQFQDAQQLPMMGYVKQVGKVSGLRNLKTVFEPLSAEIEVFRAFQEMTIEGFVPKFVNGGQNTITVRVDGLEIGKYDVKDNFVITMPQRQSKGNRFRLQIELGHIDAPADAPNKDNAGCGFVLKHIIFD